MEGRSDLILDAALIHFGKHGFAKSTIGDIAKTAQVAVGTIYLYYKNKEELLSACASRFHLRHVEFAKALLTSDKEPPQKLREYLLNRYMHWEKEIAESRIGSDIAWAMIHIAPDTNRAEQQLWLETLKSILKEAENKKIYQFDSLAKELRIFLHCMVGFFPLPGLANSFTPRKKDLVDAIEWFDKKWRTHD